MALAAGMTATVEAVVDDGMTAAAVGSGLVRGLATPSMVALMEAAAVEIVRPYLEEGRSSVGTRLEIEHLAPTPVGMRVRASATLEVLEERRLVFDVSVEDEVGQVGRGTHERYLIDLAAFEQKLARRGQPRS